MGLQLTRVGRDRCSSVSYVDLQYSRGQGVQHEVDGVKNKMKLIFQMGKTQFFHKKMKR